MSVSRFGRSFLVVLFTLPAAPGVLAQGTPDAARGSPAAAQALERARAAEGALRGLKGEEKREGMLKAAAAYQAVLDRFPAAGREGSEAALKLGRLYVRLKDADMALKCFNRVEEFSSETRNLALARIEVGHLYRRARQYDLAVSHYLKVVDRFHAEADLCADALEWAGKCRERKKDLSGAREAWRRMIEFSARDPLGAVRAYDLIACSLAKDQEEEKAREVLEECRSRFGTSLPAGREGERLRKALATMRVLKLLDRPDEPGLEGCEAEDPPGGEAIRMP